MNKKIALLIISILLICCVFAYRLYSKIYLNNVKQTTFIYIPTQASFNTLVSLVSPFLKDQKSFIWVAEKKNYPNKIRAGKYKITEGMNNDELVDHLRGGKAEIINLTFNNQDTFEKLAGRVAKQIEADSVSVLKAMTNESFLKNNDLNLKTALVIYIPNSYDFYWNTSAEGFRDKMLQEYQRFWNAKKLAKAKKQNLTPLEVSTLASIVQKETATVSERATVAGLYLNRLRDFWPLQADPTIIFAIKQKYGEETDIKRVLNKDLTIDSPYNTYSNFGLPPGPIGMPDISSIDAVLNPVQHKYYYMCASVENMGKHVFAKSLQEHNINANKYQKWVNQQGIKR